MVFGELLSPVAGIKPLGNSARNSRAAGGMEGERKKTQQNTANSPKTRLKKTPNPPKTKPHKKSCMKINLFAW